MDIQKFGVWLDDAQQFGICAMRRFARTARRDLDAITNELTEAWSNGQTAGHINRLKTLKRAMYGRAGAKLLRARMLPLHLPIQHEKILCVKFCKGGHGLAGVMRLGGGGFSFAP